MSITDELREWASVEVPYKYGHQLTAIADRIDAEHEEAIQQVLMGEGGVPATDENMAEHGWVRLPVDADGEYIHVGDVMEDADGEVFTVSSIDYGFHSSANRKAAAWMLWSIDADFDEPASQCRHHHIPTVEDVLTELTEEVWNRCCIGTTASDSGIRELVSEYAAKLRLAGDAE